MNPILKTIRAVGAEFAGRIYKPLAITFGSIFAVLFAASIWLVTLNAWWWILLILVVVLMFIAAALFAIAGVLLRFVRPDQTKMQTTAVKSFVDKIQSLSDVAGTPKVVILFHIVRDLVTKNKNGYVRRISSETLSMQHDFRDITKSFE
jgi:hypothetical protein